MSNLSIIRIRMMKGVVTETTKNTWVMTEMIEEVGAAKYG